MMTIPIFLCQMEMCVSLGNPAVIWLPLLAPRAKLLDDKSNLGVPAVCNTLSRNRYFDMKKCTHFADSQNLIKGDKMSKISFLYAMLNNLIQLCIFHELLSVDESLMPYFGRLSVKIFTRRKPIRFAIKYEACVGYKSTHIIRRFTEEKSQRRLRSWKLQEK